VKNVLLVNALLVILFLSDTHGGRTHDLRIAEATPYPLPAGSGLLGSVSKVEMDCDCCHTGPRLRSLYQEGLAHDVHRGPLPSLPE
jgi:hypothetical protein